jgi:hypothetical protein
MPMGQTLPTRETKDAAKMANLATTEICQLVVCLGGDLNIRLLSKNVAIALGPLGIPMCYRSSTQIHTYKSARDMRPQGILA